MARIVVVNWMTLDGVMQGPGRPGEDTSEGFTHSGWAEGYTDEIIGRKLGELMSGEHEFLFGRRSYDIMLQSWNQQGGPFKHALNSTTKYVASTNPQIELEWPNSVLLSGDVTASVTQLKRDSARDLIIMGSSMLIGALMLAGLIDEYLLMVAPVVLGEGRKLFPDGATSRLVLDECIPASTGALVARYQSKKR